MMLISSDSAFRRQVPSGSPSKKGKEAHRAFIKASRITHVNDGVSLHYCMPRLKDDDTCDPFGVPSKYKWFMSVNDAEWNDKVEAEIRAEMEGHANE